MRSGRIATTALLATSRCPAAAIEPRPDPWRGSGRLENLANQDQIGFVFTDGCVNTTQVGLMPYEANRRRGVGTDGSEQYPG